MHQVTSLVIDTPDQPMTTRLLHDETAAMSMLRQLYPDLAANISDDELVHHLAQEGVRARIEQHDLSELQQLAELLEDNPVPSAPYGDLYLIGDWILPENERRGTYLRPATEDEARMSASCALLDGGSGVFGVRIILADEDGEEDPEPAESAAAAPEFVRYGTPAWAQVLATSGVRYCRVENIPAQIASPVREETGPDL